MLLIDILASVCVMLVSLVGKLTTWRAAGSLIERNIHFLVSFAAGVLLVVAYNLSVELVEHAGSLGAGAPWIAIGAALVLAGFRFLPQFHHHHDKDDHTHSSIDANRILASDAIHNIGDGVVIVISFAASAVVGIASTISIIVHEMLQEISEFFVLREAGMSVRSALMWNFATSSTILVGVIGAYFALQQFEAIEVPILGLAAGAYLVVVFHDLIPHSLAGPKDALHYVRHALYFLTGAALMSIAIFLAPHTEA